MALWNSYGRNSYVSSSLVGEVFWCLGRLRVGRGQYFGESMALRHLQSYTVQAADDFIHQQDVYYGKDTIDNRDEK